MEENIKKAFDFAADSTKQLITLSTGIIALSITFSEKLIINTSYEDKILLISSWLFFIFSILFGILTLLALTGTLQPSKNKDNANDDSLSNKSKKKDPTPSIYSNNIRVFSGLQIVTFIVALILIVFFGGITASKPSIQDTKINDCENCIQIIKESRFKLMDSLQIDTILIPK